MSKTRVSYIDNDGQSRILSISNDLLPYYDKYRKTRDEVESGKWSGVNKQKACDCMEKCIAEFTYQTSKDEPMTCECGATVIKNNMSRHRATAKHTKAIEIMKDPKTPIVIAKTDIMCECGMVVSKANCARHIKGSRHTKHMESK